MARQPQTNKPADEAPKSQDQADTGGTPNEQLLKEDPQANLSPGDRDPANISQRDPSGADQHAPQTEGSTAGDINAGEGNDKIGGGDEISTSNSAGARSQDGPSQPHLNQDTVRELERTDDPMQIAIVEGQEKEAVEGRIADELGNLAVDQSVDTTFRTGTGEVAYAQPGTKNASNMGVQQDASGHFESIAHTRSAASGTRV